MAAALPRVMAPAQHTPIVRALVAELVRAAAIEMGLVRERAGWSGGKDEDAEGRVGSEHVRVRPSGISASSGRTDESDDQPPPVPHASHTRREHVDEVLELDPRPSERGGGAGDGSARAASVLERRGDDGA